MHKGLRMSPAMAAGVSDRLRDVEWIVSVIDARAPDLGPRGHVRSALLREEARLSFVDQVLELAQILLQESGSGYPGMRRWRRSH